MLRSLKTAFNNSIENLRQNRYRNAIEQNSGLILTGFLSIIVLILAILNIYCYQRPKELKIVQIESNRKISKSKYCKTRNCLIAAYKLALSSKSPKNPCNDFYKTVCKNTTNKYYSIKTTQYLDPVNYTEFLKLNENWQISEFKLENVMLRFFRTCRNFDEYDFYAFLKNKIQSFGVLGNYKTDSDYQIVINLLRQVILLSPQRNFFFILRPDTEKRIFYILNPALRVKDYFGNRKNEISKIENIIVNHLNMPFSFSSYDFLQFINNFNMNQDEYDELPSRYRFEMVLLKIFDRNITHPDYLSDGYFRFHTKNIDPIAEKNMNIWLYNLKRMYELLVFQYIQIMLKIFSFGNIHETSRRNYEFNNKEILSKKCFQMTKESFPDIFNVAYRNNISDRILVDEIIRAVKEEIGKTRYRVTNKCMRIIAPREVELLKRYEQLNIDDVDSFYEMKWKLEIWNNSQMIIHNEIDNEYLYQYSWYILALIGNSELLSPEFPKYYNFGAMGYILARSLSDQCLRLHMSHLKCRLERIVEMDDIIARSIAFRAYQSSALKSGKKLPTIGNFSDTKLFFYTAARTFCEMLESYAETVSEKNEILKMSFSKSPEFWREFECAPDSPMNSYEKCAIS